MFIDPAALKDTVVTITTAAAKHGGNQVEASRDIYAPVWTPTPALREFGSTVRVVHQQQILFRTKVFFPTLNFREKHVVSTLLYKNHGPSGLGNRYVKPKRSNTAFFSRHAVARADEPLVLCPNSRKYQFFVVKPPGGRN